MRSALRLFALSMVALLLFACVAPPIAMPVVESTVEEHDKDATEEHAEAPHWGYEGEGAPEHWGHLSSEWAVCSEGTKQSPINLDSATENDLTNIEFSYQPSAVNILNNGHTIQVNYDEGSYIIADGTRYDLLQFHVHAPSEHSVGGELFPAELHLVHRSAEGNLAVVGIMLAEGAENAAYAPVWNNLPAEESPVVTLDVTVDAATLLPDGTLTYRYSGSLTTPPCTEGVSWFVMTTPVEISTEQMTAFLNIYEGNNRPVQPLNERELILDTTP